METESRVELAQAQQRRWNKSSDDMTLCECVFGRGSGLERVTYGFTGIYAGARGACI